MVVGNWGAIGNQGAIGNWGATNGEGPRLWIGVVGNPRHLHATGNISAREPCPKAHCIQDGG